MQSDHARLHAQKDGKGNETSAVIRKILEPLGSRGNRRKPALRANAPPVLCVVEDVDGNLPTPDDDMVDPIYPVGAYF